MHRHLLLVTLATFTATPRAQGLTLIEGATSTALGVRVIPESSPGAAGTTLLQNVEFLPIELAGRTVGQDLQTEAARRDLRNGLWRIELPGGGRVFQYRRNGGAQWGYLQVHGDGTAAVVLEQNGGGPGGIASPFGDRIGVAADGGHAFVPVLGGGAFVVRLDGQLFPSTNAPARAIPLASEVQATSVMVGASCAFFVTADDRLWRCQLADGGMPVDCSVPAVSNGFYQEELAMSGDGRAVVCLYGVRLQQSLWLLAETGSATLLPPPPSKYEGANYLPEGTGHPKLLLNDDATRLMYVDAQSRDEIWLLDTGGVLPSLQVTEDQIFQPYIGIHVLPRFRGPKLFVAIGDANLMDWYQVQLQATGTSVNNLTGTGSLQMPFPAGTLAPAVAAPAGNTMLATEAAAPGLFALRSIDTLSGATAVQLTDALAAPLAGSALSGPADLVVHAQSGDRLFFGGSAAPIVTAPPGISIAPPSRGPVFTATMVEFAPGLGVLVLFAPGGPLLTTGLLTGVTQLCMTASNGCLIIAPQPLYIAPGVTANVNAPPAAIRVCVSGAGG